MIRDTSCFSGRLPPVADVFFHLQTCESTVCGVAHSGECADEAHCHGATTWLAKPGFYGGKGKTRRHATARRPRSRLWAPPARSLIGAESPMQGFPADRPAHRRECGARRSQTVRGCLTRSATRMGPPGRHGPAPRRLTVKRALDWEERYSVACTDVAERRRSVAPEVSRFNRAARMEGVQRSTVSRAFRRRCDACTRAALSRRVLRLTGRPVPACHPQRLI